MKRIGIVLPLMLVATPAYADRKTWSDASSVGAYGLAAVALGLPLFAGDTRGAEEAGGSLAAAELVAQGFKQAVPETRPDGSDRKSFPSGHTALAFAAAATLHNRDGWQAGLPAYVVATFVGVARVEAKKHHWYDALAGAAIGEASGLLITHRRNERVSLIPWADSNGAGFALAARF